MENHTTSIQDGEPKRGNGDDHEYAYSYLRAGWRALDANTDAGAEPLFTTDAHKRHDTTLWDAYLNSFPPEQRQFHNCSCCRHFIQRFGTLVTIKDGRTTPAVWDVDDAPELYKPAVEALARLVRRAKVTGIFLCEEQALGQPVTGIWRHFAVLNGVLFQRTTKTAKPDDGRASAGLRQRRAERCPRSRLQCCCRRSHCRRPSSLALGKRSSARQVAVSQGVRGASQPFRLVARQRVVACHRRRTCWLLPSAQQHDQTDRHFVIEQACSSGTVRLSCAEEIEPTIYQRPQAAPTVGSIAVAEKLVEQLGIAPSLRRRFARLEDVLEAWGDAPTVTKAQIGSDALRSRSPRKTTPPTMRVPPVVITWEKFARTVLPTAKSSTHDLRAGHSAALVTASVPEAPPIFQWDLPERRNPVSWYVYQGGSLASAWDLDTGWAKVTTIALEPPVWFGAKNTHHGDGALFILEGCKDKKVDSAGLGIFPSARIRLRESSQ